MKKQRFILKNHHKIQSDIQVEAQFEIEDKTLRLEFNIEGEIENYIFLKPSTQERANDLWKATCFEFFFGYKGSKSYTEVNISPSTKWNIYSFKGYRELLKEKNILTQPSIKVFQEKNRYSLLVTSNFNESFLNNGLVFNLAVILLDKNHIRHFYTLNRTPTTVDFHKKESWKVCIE